MAKSGPRKVNRYAEQFRATAVKLSRLPGVLIQDVAAALDIHPFMLSRRRNQVRDSKPEQSQNQSGQVLFLA